MVERGGWLERLHHRWVDAPLPTVLWGQPLLVLPQAQVAAAVGAQRCAERGKNLGGAE